MSIAKPITPDEQTSLEVANCDCMNRYSQGRMLVDELSHYTTSAYSSSDSHELANDMTRDTLVRAFQIIHLPD